MPIQFRIYSEGRLAFGKNHREFTLGKEKANKTIGRNRPGEANAIADVGRAEARSSPESASVRKAVMEVVLPYAVFSLAWIYFSDRALHFFVRDPQLQIWWATGKGWLFVGVTAVLLALLLARTFRSLQEGVRALKRSEDRLALALTAAEERLAERTRMSDELAETERLSHETLDALSAHVAILDETGEIVRVNEAWRAFARENATSINSLCEGANYLTACENAVRINGNDGQRFAAAIRSVMAGTEPSFSLDYPCHSLRERRWFTACVTRFGSAGLKRAVVSHHDITKLRGAQESLRFQAHMLQQSGEAFIATDPAGRITYMNDYAQDLYGWPIDDALARNILDVTVPQISRVQASEILHRLQRGESWSGEILARCRNGKVFPASVTNTALLDDEGKLIAICGISRDISIRRQADAALRESEERFRQFVESIQDVFWMVDLAYTKTLYVSPAYESVWGRSRESLRANPHSFVEAVLPEDRHAMADYLERQKVAATEVEYRIERPDGSIRWIRDRAFPVLDESGKIYRLVGIAQDITERKEPELCAFAGRLNGVHKEVRGPIERSTCPAFRDGQDIRPNSLLAADNPE